MIRHYQRGPTSAFGSVHSHLYYSIGAHSTRHRHVILYGLQRVYLDKSHRQKVFVIIDSIAHLRSIRSLQTEHLLISTIACYNNYGFPTMAAWAAIYRPMVAQMLPNHCRIKQDYPSTNRNGGRIRASQQTFVRSVKSLIEPYLSICLGNALQ